MKDIAEQRPASTLDCAKTQCAWLARTSPRSRWLLPVAAGLNRFLPSSYTLDACHDLTMSLAAKQLLFSSSAICKFTATLRYVHRHVLRFLFDEPRIPELGAR